jgi:hypothetical protein
VQGCSWIGDNFGSAFLLGDNIHGPTFIGGIINNTSNMLEFFIYLGFLYSSDIAKIQTNKMGW